MQTQDFSIKQPSVGAPGLKLVRQCQNDRHRRSIMDTWCLLILNNYNTLMHPIPIVWFTEL